MLPGVSAQNAQVFKTDQVFMMAHRFLVYPNGLEFTLHVRFRNPEDYQGDLVFNLHGPRSQPLSDDFLRLGVMLADGTKWTNLERRWQPKHADDRPKQPIIGFRRGGGGEDSYNMQYWVWPLPPAGPLTIVAEWPAFAIPDCRLVIDATELRARAADAEAIWPIDAGTPHCVEND